MPTLQEQLEEAKKSISHSAIYESRMAAFSAQLKGRIEHKYDYADLFETHKFLHKSMDDFRANISKSLKLYNNIIDKMAAELFKMQESDNE